MTDLPRTIPTDPAEQERLMPEWVKGATVEAETAAGVDCVLANVCPDYGETFAHALTIWQWYPEPVDPDLRAAQDVCAELWPSDAEYYSSGRADKSNAVRSALTAIKRGRALERGEG